MKLSQILTACLVVVLMLLVAPLTHAQRVAWTSTPTNIVVVSQTNAAATVLSASRGGSGWRTGFVISNTNDFPVLIRLDSNFPSNTVAHAIVPSGATLPFGLGEGYNGAITAHSCSTSALPTTAVIQWLEFGN